MLWGVDVSHHQGAVDWDRVGRDGITFAICKATEGTDWVDPRVRVNLRGMRGAGLVPGVYHFLRESDTRAQVDNFVSTVRDFDGLLVVVDVEKAANGRFPSYPQVREFVRLLRRRTGDRPVIVYTGEWFWRGVLGNPDARELRALLWHSRYVGNAVPVGHPRAMHAGVVDSWWKPAYGGWSRATFLQFSSRARTAGVSPIDADVFRGGISELRRLAA
jgi:GH25 family lysozyme M1 (1,4-beta-N-acetylmuramidase)